MTIAFREYLDILKKLETTRKEIADHRRYTNTLEEEQLTDEEWDVIDAKGDTLYERVDALEKRRQALRGKAEREHISQFKVGQEVFVHDNYFEYEAVVSGISGTNIQVTGPKSPFRSFYPVYLMWKNIRTEDGVFPDGKTYCPEMIYFEEVLTEKWRSFRIWDREIGRRTLTLEEQRSLKEMLNEKEIQRAYVSTDKVGVHASTKEKDVKKFIGLVREFFKEITNKGEN